MPSYVSGIYVNLGGTDQPISGTDPVVVPINNLVWDFSDDVTLAADGGPYWTAPTDGIWEIFTRLRINSIVNATSVEAALFQLGTGPDGSDLYWSCCGFKQLGSSDNEAQLSSWDRLPFNTGEIYMLKVILTGTDPSANIVGDVTKSAWGLTYFSDQSGF